MQGVSNVGVRKKVHRSSSRSIHLENTRQLSIHHNNEPSWTQTPEKGGYVCKNAVVRRRYVVKMRMPHGFC